MQHWKLGKWCNQAVRLIRYPPDRKEVFEELRQHVDDRSDLFLEQGFSEEEAVEKTLLAMGDADELAPQLAAIHRPFWGFAYSITKWFARIALIALLLVVLATHIPPLLNHIISWAFNDSVPSGSKIWNPYGVGESPTYGNRVLYLKPGCQYESDGYIVTLTDAVIWKLPVETNPGDLYFQLEITAKHPWVDPPAFEQYLSARDSLGNVYIPNQFINAVPFSDYTGSVWGSTTKTGPFTWTYQGSLSHSLKANTQWIDICYQRDGRDMALRIDLNGGNIE